MFFHLSCIPVSLFYLPGVLLLLFQFPWRSGYFVPTAWLLICLSYISCVLLLCLTRLASHSLCPTWLVSDICPTCPVSHYFRLIVVVVILLVLCPIAFVSLVFGSHCFCFTCLWVPLFLFHLSLGPIVIASLVFGSHWFCFTCLWVPLFLFHLSLGPIVFVSLVFGSHWFCFTCLWVPLFLFHLSLGPIVFVSLVFGSHCFCFTCLWVSLFLLHLSGVTLFLSGVSVF